MRPFDSAYDRDCAEKRSEDPGNTEYALISDHNGPCSIVADYPDLETAIEAARTMDTDEAPTELEDELDVEAQTVADLIDAAEREGWRVVAEAGAGEYWTVLTH